MGGGLMQLVAYGAQDVYLTGNPQITFFKVIHRRHTNFAMESIQQTFSGQPDFGKKVTCTVSRNGDLITRVYLDATLPEIHATGGSFAWVDYVGEMLVDSVELEIGGQRIDKQYGDWMHIWNQLSLPVGLQHGYKLMVGQNAARLACEDSFGCAELDPACNLQHATNHVGAYKVHVPLQFWFCTNPGLALPLIALQYHEVKIIVAFRDFNHLYSSGCGEENSVVVNGGNGGHYKMLHYLLITSTLTLMNADALPNNHTNTSLLNYNSQVKNQLTEAHKKLNLTSTTPPKKLYGLSNLMATPPMDATTLPTTQLVDHTLKVTQLNQLNYNLTVMTDSSKEVADTSILSNHSNTTAMYQEATVLTHTHSHLNQKNTNQLVLAT